MEAGEIRELTNSENTYLTLALRIKCRLSSTDIHPFRAPAWEGPQGKDDGGPTAHVSQVSRERVPGQVPGGVPSSPPPVSSERPPFLPIPSCPAYRKLEPRALFRQRAPGPPHPLSTPKASASSPPGSSPSTLFSQHRAASRQDPAQGMTLTSLLGRGEQRTSSRAWGRVGARCPKAPGQPPPETRSDLALSRDTCAPPPAVPGSPLQTGLPWGQELPRQGWFSGPPHRAAGHLMAGSEPA